MTKVIDQDGNQLEWIAVYARHHVEYREECEDLNDALDLLTFGEEAGQLASISVISPTGEVLEGMELSAACRLREEEERKQRTIEA